MDLVMSGSTDPIPEDDVVSDVLPRHEGFGTLGVPQELLGLGVRHIQGQADRALPVLADCLQHL